MEYKIITAKNSSKVPVINGIYLHSEIDPIIEAQKMVSSNNNLIKNKNALLVLGLGLGYHVSEILRKMHFYHGDNFKVWVIEPSAEIVRDCKIYNSIFDKNLSIINEKSLDDYYSNHEFISFLILGPGIFSHPPTLQVHEDFFKSFLKYRAPNKIKDISEGIHRDDIKKYLQNYHVEDDFEDIILKIKNKKGFLNKTDLLFLAYNQI